MRQRRTLSLRGPAVLLSKPASFSPETDARLLLLSPAAPPLPVSHHHVHLSNLRLAFPDTPTRDAFLAAAHAAIRQMSAGIDRYAVKAKVRDGVSAQLYLVQRRHDARRFLMKRVGKDAMGCRSRLEGLVSERAVLAEAAARRSPFITRLVDAFETDTHLCLVLDRPEYADLRSVLHRSRHGTLSERVTRKLFAHALLALQDCHRMGYLHRGVKLAAFMLDARGHLKLADFGLAKPMHVDYVPAPAADSPPDHPADEPRFRLVGRTTSFVGTRRYMAPELIGGGAAGQLGYGVEADVWALGVVLYVMLVGRFPFGHASPAPDDDNLFDAICGQPLHFPNTLRKEARALLQGMLHRDVRQRWDLNRVKACAWMRGIDWSDLRFHAEHDEPQQDVLKDLADNGVAEETYAEDEAQLSFTRLSVGSAGSSVSAGSLRSSDGRGKMAELVGFGHINYPQRL